MKTTIATLVVVLGLSLNHAAASDPRESYVARISEKDHFNSNGDRLVSAAAVIRQDRANFHKYDRRDREDQGDAFFASAENRDLLEKYLQRGSADRAAIRAILNSTPLIRVSIFTSGRTGKDFISVTVLED